MPFQPLSDNDPDKLQPGDLGLLIIRVITVAIFSYYQLGSQLSHAVDYVWDNGEWDLVNQLAGKNLPFPSIVTLAAVAILTISLLGVLIGIFTRFNALILTILSGFILIAPIILSATLNPQSLALYVGLFAGLALGGGGRLSLDYALANRRERRRKPL